MQWMPALAGMTIWKNDPDWTFLKHWAPAFAGTTVLVAVGCSVIGRVILELDEIASLH